MDDQLIRQYKRWQDAEDSGRDDEADAAFAEVFRSASHQPVLSSRFTAETMDAVADAAARDAQRAHRVRRFLVPAAVVAVAAAVYFSAGMLASGFSAAIVWLLNLMVGGVVTVAGAAQSGPDGWSVMSSLGRAVAAIISNPAVTVTIFAIQGFAIAALILLQRLLGSDRESFR